MVSVNNKVISINNIRRQVHYNLKFKSLCKTAFQKIKT